MPGVVSIRKDRRVLIAAGAVLLLAVAALLWWRPWDPRSSCVEDDAHAVDAASGICYAVPEGWTPAAPDTLEPGYTSGLAADDGSGSVVVGGLDALLDGDLADSDDVAEIAEHFASTFGFEGSGSGETETWTVDDRPAATASGAIGGDGAYVRVTVVDLAAGMTVLVSTVLTDSPDAEAVLEDLHDSISVK